MTTPQTEQPELTAGRELDALVAEKVMGWHIVTDFDLRPPEKHWNNAKGYVCLVAGNKLNDGREMKGFSPSTDIADAWKVVEKMRERGLDVYLRFVSTWTAEFDSVSGDVNGFADADTAPLAICLAALKAVQS